MKSTNLVTRAKWLLLLIISLCVSPHPAKAQLNMLFDNISSYDSTNVWVTILRGQTSTDMVSPDYVPDITYVDNTNADPFVWTPVTNTVYITDSNGILTNTVITVGQGYSESIPISEIDANGGLQWISNASAAQVVISYGAPIDSTNITSQEVTYYANAADKSNNILTTNYNQLAFYSTGQLSANNPSDPSYTTSYQNFELTYTRTNNGDQGDITAINYMGSIVGISSYASSNATGTPLQSVGYKTNVSVSSLLADFTNNIGSNAYGNTTVSSIVTNSSGNVVRVVGPSSFIGGLGDGLGSYSNFSDYLGYVQTSPYSNTLMSNYSGYSTVPGGPSVGGIQTNVLVTFVMTNQVTGNASNGYGLSDLGNVILVYTPYSNNVPQPGITTSTITGLQFQVPASYTNATNGVFPSGAAQFIYGASSGIHNYFVANSAYTTLQSDLSVFVDGANSNAMLDVTAQIEGEISQAFDFGLAGSTNLATNGVPIGEMPSGMWWQATNGVSPFSGAETNPAYYNAYAALIANASSNQVYSTPYSDRFSGSNSPLINDTYYSNTKVNSWLITTGDPLAVSGVPEPSSFMLFGITLILGFVGYRLRRVVK